MKTTTRFLFASALAFAAALTPAGAASFSDDFSAGLGNWTTIGDVALQNGSAIFTNALTGITDDPSALNVSGVDPVAAAETLDAFAGLAPGALDINLIDQATEGSAFKRTFSVTAGDKLTFDWQLLTRDVTGSDYGFFAINGVLTSLAKSSDAATTAASPYLTQTGSGLAPFEYVFSTTGNVTVAFGIVDVGDYSTSSALLVDNFAITAVPEPTTTAAAMAGLLGLLLVFRRRRRASR